MTRPRQNKRRLMSRVGRSAPWAPSAAWAYLLAGRGRFWSTESDFVAGEAPAQWPTVAMIVPARDEAALLPQTLPSLLDQDYPGHAWAVLVDDQSSDGTAALARELAARGGGRGLGLSIVDGGPSPAGWAGKTWAMAQGVAQALAVPVTPDWFLFTDADIYHPPSSLRDLVTSALNGRRACVSVMARLPTATAWERLLMPAFVYFFAQIYPFKWVNDRYSRAAAAAGGCMLVEAEALRQAGGIAAIAQETIDDIALAKALKGAGFDIWLGLAGEGHGEGAPRVESCRGYPHLSDIWDMVARNAYTQLGQSPLALAGTVAGLSAVYLAPPVLVYAGISARRPSMAIAGLAAWAAMASSYLPICRYYRAPAIAALALPFTASLYMTMTLSSAWRQRAGGVPWKGRQPMPAMGAT